MNSIVVCNNIIVTIFWQLYNLLLHFKRLPIMMKADILVLFTKHLPNKKLRQDSMKL